MPFSVHDEQGQLLLARGGQVVASAQQLEALLSRGLCSDSADARALRSLTREEPSRRPTRFDLWNPSPGRLDRLLHSVAGEPGFTLRCDEFARQFVSLVGSDPDIAIYVSAGQGPHWLDVHGLKTARRRRPPAHAPGQPLPWRATAAAARAAASGSPR